MTNYVTAGATCAQNNRCDLQIAILQIIIAIVASNEHYDCPPGLLSSIFNRLPDDKILDWSNLKQIADNLRCISNEK